MRRNLPATSRRTPIYTRDFRHYLGRRKRVRVASITSCATRAVCSLPVFALGRPHAVPQHDRYGQYDARDHETDHGQAVGADSGAVQPVTDGNKGPLDLGAPASVEHSSRVSPCILAAGTHAKASA